MHAAASQQFMISYWLNLLVVADCSVPVMLSRTTLFWVAMGYRTISIPVKPYIKGKNWEYMVVKPREW